MSVGTTTSANGLALGTSVTVTFAANGTCVLSWFDGTHYNSSYASAPYTSWTTLQVATTTGIVASQRLDTSDTVNAIFYVSSGLDYKPLTLSGSTYSQGTADLVATIATGGSNLMGCLMEKDVQNRYWAVLTDRIGSTVTAYTSTTPNTATWTNNHSVAWASNVQNNFPAGGIVGNFLLFIYPTATSSFFYQRLDVHNVSLGSWSTATALTPGGSSPTYDNYFSFRGTSTVGVMANSSGSGIWSRLYTAGTDTWASAVQLSSGASDTRPTVIVGSDGNLYVVWQSFVGTNNYAIVYKMYNVGSSTWDTSATTLVASGANNVNPVGGSNNGVLGVSYITGTATPWTINFASFSFSTGTPLSFTESNTFAESVSLQVTPSVTESLTESEQFSSQEVLAVTDDVLTFAETVIVSLSSLENLTFVESVSLQETLSLTESLTQSEQATVRNVLSLTETLTESEITTLQSSLSTTETLTENEQVSFQVIQNLAETVTLAETITQNEVLSSSESLTENEQASFQVSLSVSESLTLSETFVAQPVFGVIESLTLIESVTTQEVLSFSETLTFSETLAFQFPVIILESQTLSESIQTASTISISEQLAVLDWIWIQRPDRLVVSESFALTETLSSSEQLTLAESVQGSQSLSFTESLTLQESLLRQSAEVVSEQLAFSEIVSVSPSLLFTESQTLLESLLVSIVLVVSEQLTLTETVSTPASFVFIYTEQLTIVESFVVPFPFFPYPFTPYPSSYFVGGTTMPLFVNDSEDYAVGGITLDVQPTLCTVPVSTAPIAMGTSFYLGFPTLSTMLQQLFVIGAQFTLQFPLSDGTLRSAPVLVLESTTIGSQLLVTCMLLQISQAYVWTMPAQI